MSGVVVERAGLVESVHRVHVAVVDSEGRLTASAGDPERIVFHRSTAKPFQAVPLVDDNVVERLGRSFRRRTSMKVTWNAVPTFPSIVQQPRRCFGRVGRWTNLREAEIGLGQDGCGVLRADFQLETHT